MGNCINYYGQQKVSKQPHASLVLLFNIKFGILIFADLEMAKFMDRVFEMCRANTASFIPCSPPGKIILLNMKERKICILVYLACPSNVFIYISTLR